MKKTLMTLVLCSFAFGLGFGINNVAFSNIQTPKIAYVNVGKLLSKSATLKNAENAKVKQTQDMLKWYDTASRDIQKQKTQAGKKTLAKKYESQLTQKKKNIKSAYAKKINAVDDQLSKAITAKANELGYTLVLRGDVVLVGGTDITSQILPLVK